MRREERAGRLRAAEGTPRPAGLLEREREMERVQRAVASALAGRGQGVLVTGAAGMGKSHLLRWARERAEEQGLLALSARGAESESDISLSVPLQLLERHLDRMGREARRSALSGAAALALPLFEGRGWGLAASQHGSIEPLLHGLHWLVSNLADTQPVLMAVDDVHCCDPASQRFLLYLLRRLEDLSVILLMARRPAATPPNVLQELIAEPGLWRIALPALSPSGVRMLLEDGCGTAVGERFAAACTTATGGNPFLVKALIAALLSDGIEPDDENTARVALLNPEDVGHQLTVRITRLGDAAAALCRAAAVLGDGCSLDEASELAGLDGDEAADAADRLIADDVLAAADPLQFSHPLHRSAVYEEIPTARRAATHLRAAELHFRRGASVDHLAQQLLRSSRCGEAWAMEALRNAAARAAQRGNTESVVRYLARALREPADPQARAQLLVELARAEAMLGSPRAEERLHEALDLIGERRERARAHQALGQILYTQGRSLEAAAAFEAALTLLEVSAGPGGAGGQKVTPSSTGEMPDPLLHDLRAAYFSAASLEPALNARAREMIAPLLQRPPGGETAAERGALAALAVHQATTRGAGSQVVALAWRAWGNGALLDEEGPDGWAWSLVTAALCWSDGIAQALEICAAVGERARATGSPMAYATASYCAQFPALLAGHIAAARAHGDAALEARRLGWRTYETALVGVQARVLIEQDELDEAEQLLAAELRPAAGETPQLFIPLEARAQLHLLRGNPQAALEDFLRAGERFGAISATNPTLVPWRLGAVKAALELGQPGQAWELSRELSSVAEDTGVPSQLAQALRARALLAEGSQALALAEEAVARLEDSPAELERIRCLLLLGTLRRRQGERRRAVETLREALQRAGRAGAALLERQVIAELRVAGARPRRLAFSGADALTASERRVAEMAGAGASNREIAQALFLTTRTVEQHLYNAYKKLGISSRRDLSTILGDGSETPP